MKIVENIAENNKNTPILIAGQTASGKSDLAFQIAEKLDGTIINADAIQVFSNWRILTARPSAEDEEKIEHKLYGHVDGDADYSVGTWLKQIKKILSDTSKPIIVGGTGLYFSALSEGLVDIPEIPKKIRLEADSRISKNGLESLIKEIDKETARKIDLNNPRRVQRAWEVLISTGRSLNSWHNEKSKPILNLNQCKTILVDGEISSFNKRITKRFDQMMEQGLIREGENNLENWNETFPSSKAIGARELIAHLQNKILLMNLKSKY